MVEVLAIVPARGGSKSIPRKNLLRLAQHPLIAYSIEHALRSSLINRVIVSTDDKEIAGVAQAYGAEVPFTRPAEFATDLATDLQVFQHALTALWQAEGYAPDIVVQLRPTDPVRSVQTVDRAIATLIEHPEADSLKSIKLASYTPYKMWRIEDGYVKPFIELAGIPEAHSMPRQMLPAVYQGSGYVDVIRPHTILELGSMVGKVVVPFHIDELCFDLDYPEQIAELAAALERGHVRPQLHVDRTGT